LDLFAGIGTYSFCLVPHTHVTAVEGEKSMVEAMRNATKKHHLQHFNALQKDLFHHPLSKNELSTYDMIIINPPRPGAKAQTIEVAASNTNKVLMISCNPATFARDAKILKDAGFALRKLTPVDQFVYSAHLELLAEFTR
jgi:23S rRNA (uracil1939-C5)-methyltransferase